MSTVSDILPSIADEPWRRDAACSFHDDYTLWDVSIDGETLAARHKRQASARVICRRCPVHNECAAAVDIARDSGIRDGRLLPLFTQQHRHDLPPAGEKPRELHEIRHGTEAGARAHYRLGESACEACRIAAMDAKKRRQRKAAS